MNELLKNLNKEQLTAVTHTTGPMLVIAGAGTGKTTVITKRIAWLIEQKLAKPSEILALTFTDKAAKEMDERIMELLPYGVFDFTASTFHSFCQDILKTYGIIAGLSPDFELLTQSQQILFIREHFDEFKLNLYKPITNPNKFISALVKLFSRCKDENISVNAYLDLAKIKSPTANKNQNSKIQISATNIEEAQLLNEQAQAYATYERLKMENNYFDFGDLIEKTLRLLKNRNTVLNELQNRYKYIFVDEFQDTNYTQAQIVYLLAQKYNNITVVGDDDQSIYKFRGASISNIMEFVKHFPKAKKVVLKHNYRSTQPILDCAYEVIVNNNPNRLEIKEKINKHLLGKPADNKPEYWHFDHNSNEVKEIIDYINQQLTTDNRKLETDIAILIRTNKDAADFIDKLKENNIPYNFVGSRGLYDREEINELISYLKILANQDDNLALFHLAFSEKYHIDKTLLCRLSNLSKRKNKSLFSLIENIKTKENSDQLNLFEINEKNEASLIKIINLVKSHLEFTKTWPTSKILIDYIFKSGMYNELSHADSYLAQEKIENIRLFFHKISEFEKITNDKSLFSFIEYLKLIIEAGDNPPVFSADKYENSVNIMTIHSAKGLEFDTVFIPYLINKKFPSTERQDPIILPEELITENVPEGDIHLEEERRLFYVAVTRAKKRLILSCSDTYNDAKLLKKVSPFILEAKDKITKKIFSQKTNLDFLKIKKDLPKQSIDQTKEKLLKLSPSNLENYLDCPKKFEYSFIYRLKTDPTQATSFGDAIHNTLRDYYQFSITGDKPTITKLTEIYKTNWKEDGFSSKQEEKRSFDLGLQSIINFINSDDKKPSHIEQQFTYKINEFCKINGRIDRINQSLKHIDIIDYKTGDGRKKEKSELTKNIPLWIYALWAKERFATNDISLTLNFILNNKIISNKITSKTLENKKEKIISTCNEIYNAINKNDFPAKASEQKCSWCNYKTICPFKAKN